MSKRKDAVEFKVNDPFHSIVPYVMPKRTESEVSSIEHFDITNLLKYIEKENKKGNKLKLFHCVCYAVAKTIYHRPKMNIFIAGKKYWQRNEISLSFVAKQEFSDGADEVLMYMKIKPEMTIDDISNIIVGDVNKARKTKGNDLDKTMEFVTKLPRFILNIVFFVASRLEYHGMMPESLTKGDPNYSTVLLSNLGSIGAGAPYHHLSNYGTCSIMATIGTYFKDEIKKRTILPINIIFDERIADGFYFVKSLKITRYILEHPEELSKPISEPINIDIETKKKTVKKTKKK